MATSTIVQGLPTDYYAPNYQIEVEGQELDPQSKGDVLDVKVVMDMENLTSFDLTFNNWDDRTLSFKYSDTAQFELGKRVHVKMGYADRMVSMARGVITTMSPKFPESGPPTITVSGLDALVRLRDSKPKEGETKKYVDKADWEIAQEVAKRHGLKTNLTKSGEKHPLVIQEGKDDAIFLMNRAKRIDFDCFIRVDPKTGEDALHFVQPTDKRAGSSTRVWIFEWGKTLINFMPQLTIAKMVTKVTVKGWDPNTKSRISYTAGPSDLPGSGVGGGSSGPEAAEKATPGKEDIIEDQPISTLEEARKLAISLLRERAYGFLTGAGQVIGLPDMRPGDVVDLRGLGSRFSGDDYYVKKVEHALGGSGYLTSFEVRRDRDGKVQA